MTSDNLERVALINAIISAYHTTRLSEVPAADHILTKPTVQAAFDALSAIPVPSPKRYLADRFTYAAPGDQQEDVWLLRFCDKDRREAIWQGETAEAEAWAAWEQYAPTYNCYVFRLATLKDPPVPSPMGEELQEVTGACLSAPGSSPVGTEAPTGLRPSGDDPSRELERLYSLAKANNALARMNADRAEKAEAKLADQEAAIEWAVYLRDDAIAKRDAMYLARQESERALTRVKAALKRRSVPTMDAAWSAAFNAALDMVGKALSDSDGSPEGRDAKRLDGEATTARAEGIAQEPETPSVRKGVA